MFDASVSAFLRFRFHHAFLLLLTSFWLQFIRLLLLKERLFQKESFISDRRITIVIFIVMHSLFTVFYTNVIISKLLLSQRNTYKILKQFSTIRFLI